MQGWVERSETHRCARYRCGPNEATDKTVLHRITTDMMGHRFAPPFYKLSFWRRNTLEQRCSHAYSQGMGSIDLRLIRPSARKLVIAIYMVMVGTLFGGAYMYPDAPIRECSVGVVMTYCGKHGKEHTLTDYEGERRWETGLEIVWALGALSIVVLVARGRHDPKAPASVS
jgi:hypothetical protein